MMSEWSECNVGELEKKGLLLVQDGNHGEYRPRKNEFIDEGISFIRAADLGVGAVQFEKAGKINEVAFNRIRKGIGKDLDTVLSTKGTVGKLAYVPEGSPKFVCSPQTTFWRSLDHNFIDPLFLYYELQSRYFISQILSRKGETDMADYLSLTAQRGLTIRVPDKKVQNEVVKVLSCIDNKIELNRQTNQTLEQIAQTIFKSWFVDFEPVKAKILAKQKWATSMTGKTGENNEKAESIFIERAAMSAISGKSLEELEQLSPETQQQLKTTAALFPDALVESELGEIPDGWEVKSLDKVAHYQNGLALQKFRPEDDEDFLPVLKISQLKKGFADGKEKATVNIKPECIIDNGDIVFSWSGSLMVDVWCGGKAALNQHLFKVTSNDYPKWFYYYWTKHHLTVFQQIASDKAVTMGHIKREHLSQAKCVVPQYDLAGISLINGLLAKQIEQRIEAFTLQETRDTLLPKLLSGALPTIQISEKLEVTI